MVRENSLSSVVTTREPVSVGVSSFETKGSTKPNRRLPRSFWKVVLLALGLRFLVMWFSHPWDITTFYNMFVNLADGVSPYAELERLSRLFSTSIAHWVPAYEYFAYPPGPIYLYYLPAQVWEYIVGPQMSHFLLPGAGYVLAPREVLDPIFQVAFKAPIFAAEVGIAAFLTRLANLRIAIAYLFNPLVIVIGAAWTFESIAVLTIVAAYYYMIRDRPGIVGLSLGIGAIVKIFPVVLLPVAVLWYLARRQYQSLRRVLVTFIAVVAVAVIPMWEGVRGTLSFHAARKGGGLTFHQLTYLHDTLVHEPSLWLQAGLSPAVGSITLVGALALAYLWIWRSRPMLLNSFVVVLASFLVGSKLVNEQFTVWLIPLLLLGFAASQTRTQRRLYWAATCIPLAFAFFNVPVTGFLYPLGHIGWASFDVLAMPSELLIGTPIHAWVLALLALTYIIILALIIRYHTQRGNASLT